MKLDRKKYTLAAVLLVGLLLLLSGTVAAQPIITSFMPDKTEVDLDTDDGFVTWTVHSSTAVEYAFYVKQKVGGAINMDTDPLIGLQWYGPKNTFKYQLRTAGTYYGIVFARDAEGKLTRVATASPQYDVTVTGESTELTGLEFVGLPASGTVGEELTINVKAAGGLAPLEYAFYVFFTAEGEGAEEERVFFQWYKTEDTLSYTPLEPGAYRVQAFVKDGTGKIVNDFSDLILVTGDSQKLAITDISGVADDGTITWSVAATGPQPLDYAFYVLKGDTRVHTAWYQTLTQVDEKVSFTYKPAENGEYRLQVFAKDNYGNTVIETQGEAEAVEFEGAVGPLSVTVENPEGYDEGYPVDPEEWEVGAEYTWTAKAEGGAAPYQYAFYVFEGEARVHTKWYSSENTVAYKPTQPDPEVYSVRVFVMDGTGKVVFAYSDAIQFSGTALVPLDDLTIGFKEGCTALVERENPVGGPTKADDPNVPDPIYVDYTYDGYSLAEFDVPWVWEVQLPENLDTAGPFAYAYYLYRTVDGVDQLLKMDWYKEGEGANEFRYTPREVGSYWVKVFVQDKSNGKIVIEESIPQETRLYYFSYDFKAFDEVTDKYHAYTKEGSNWLTRTKVELIDESGKTDNLGNKNHGWVYGSGFFVERGVFTRVGTAPDIDYNVLYPNVYDELAPRGYGNQTGTDGVGLGVGGNGYRTYYEGKEGVLTLGTMTFEESDSVKGCVWQSTADDGNRVYRFAGLRPNFGSGRNIPEKREFWRYMITPNLPYGEVQFRNIHSVLPEVEGDSTLPDQEARFNFEFMISDPTGAEPYKQRVGISISASGEIRLLDSKGGLGDFDEAEGNFFMPLHPDNKTGQDFSFNNNNWNTLRIQGRADGKVDLLLNGHLVYTTVGGYYQLTNAERGTITLEVVQAAEEHELDISCEVGGENVYYDSTQVGNAYVELANYSLGILRLVERAPNPGTWKYQVY